MNANPLELDPDRLFPADPGTRSRARDLYARVAALPIISPHGHVDPRILLDDIPFSDASELFIRHDHYITRLLHASGIGLGELGARTPGAVAVSPRQVWRTFCDHWHIYAGTASGYWLRSILSQEFAVTEQPSAHTADALFDHIGAILATPGFRPRALFDRFGIDVLATTDDPMDDLAVHAAIAADPSFRGRVLPTFRPDAYVSTTSAGWAERIARLAEWHGTAATDYHGYLAALQARRHYFVEHGAVSADHGVLSPETIDLDAADAARLFEKAHAGSISDDEARVFSAHMLFEMARMSTQDGLVMTVHPGVLRNHDGETFARFGPDTGHDIPVATEFVRALRPLLQKFGNTAGFHLVLFSVDETVYSREIAPLAGYYPAVFIGAPWWFLDAPDAVLRFRAAVTETAGFSRGSGFIDDTRAFMSIPARHDMSRRLDAAFLARLVVEGRIDQASAEDIIVDLVDGQPRRVFKL